MTVNVSIPGPPKPKVTSRLQLYLDSGTLPLCGCSLGSLYRRIVGWSMKAERDAVLVMGALMMTVLRGRKADVLLHHSGQYRNTKANSPYWAASIIFRCIFKVGKVVAAKDFKSASTPELASVSNSLMAFSWAIRWSLR
jgi:hypothetical protein